MDRFNADMAYVKIGRLYDSCIENCTNSLEWCELEKMQLQGAKKFLLMTSVSNDMLLLLQICTPRYFIDETQFIAGGVRTYKYISAITILLSLPTAIQ